MAIVDAQESVYEMNGKIRGLMWFVETLEQSMDYTFMNIGEVNASLNEIDNRTYYLESIIAANRVQIKEVMFKSSETIILPTAPAAKKVERAEESKQKEREQKKR